MQASTAFWILAFGIPWFVKCQRALNALLGVEGRLPGLKPSPVGARRTGSYRIHQALLEGRLLPPELMKEMMTTVVDDGSAPPTASASRRGSSPAAPSGATGRARATAPAQQARREQEAVLAWLAEVAAEHGARVREGAPSTAGRSKRGTRAGKACRGVVATIPKPRGAGPRIRETQWLEGRLGCRRRGRWPGGSRAPAG